MGKTIKPFFKHILLFCSFIFIASNVHSQCLTTVDTDGDGIDNSCDFDDDNDGILDVNEGCSSSTTNEGLVMPPVLNDGILSNNVIGNTIWPTDVPGGGLPNQASYSSSILEPVTGATGFYVVSGVDETSSYSVSAGNVHLSSAANTTVTDVRVSIGEFNSTSPIGSSLTITNAFDHLGNQLMNLSDIQFFGIGANYGTPLDPSQLAITNPVPGTFVLTRTTIDNAVVLWFRANNGNFIQRYDATYNGVFRGDWFYNGFSRSLNTITCIDTDLDGIPDYLDTDSDNDGCPDASEGASGITTGLTTLTGGSVGGSLLNLGTTVDTDPTSSTYGVPTAAGSPQATTAAVTDATDSIACSADLSLTKVVDNAIPKVGQNISYTLTINNDGPAVATGVQVTDVLPAGLSYVSDNSATTSTTFASNIWDIGNITVGQTISLQITATVTSAGVIINTSEITQSNELDVDSTVNNGK